MEGSKVNGSGADKKGNREKYQRDGKTDEQIERVIIASYYISLNNFCFSLLVNQIFR